MQKGRGTFVRPAADYPLAMKIVVNPKYEHLRPFVERLAEPFFFVRNGETLFEGRNTVKRFEVDGTSLAVKSYKRPTPLNRLVYGLVRKSKAMRAYRHAVKLRNRGIDTPEEVAVVEVRKHGAMQQCYFVSRCSDYESLRPVTESSMPLEKSRPILDALAGFLVGMHGAGVLHNDLNIGNILYRQEASGECRFCVIDTNRMSFRSHLPMYLRLENLRRLSCGTPAYLYILRRYAEILRADAEFVQLEGAVRRLLFEWRQRTKQAFKAVFRTNKAL